MARRNENKSFTPGYSNPKKGQEMKEKKYSKIKEIYSLVKT